MTSDTLRLEAPPSTLPPGSTVWAYLRDSGGPTQDRSVEQQRQIVQEYCAKHELILSLPPFIDVHKSGGSTRNRNDFDYMISLSSSLEKPKGLIIWNFARFSRGGAYESQFYTSTLRQRGIVIHSLTDKIPEGPFAPVIETLIQIADQHKKDEAAMGAWRGLRHNVKQGAAFGVAPLGMKRTPIKITSIEGIERNGHRWDPDPDYKVRIKKAFSMKAKGKTLSQIHAETKLYSSINSYVSFFNNPIYIGTLRHGDLVIEDYCKPTIPRSLWDAVQTRMQANAERKHLHSQTDHPRRTASIYLLSGLLKCVRCDGMMNGMSSPQPYGEDYRRYQCATAKIKKTCTIKPIPAKAIEAIVLDELNNFFANPQNLIDTITEFIEDHSDQQNKVDEKLASDASQLATVRKGITNTVNALSQHGHSKALSKRLAQLEEQETQLEAGIAQLKSQSITTIQIPTIEEARASAHKIQEDLQSKDPIFIRQTLLSIISEIYVDRRGKELLCQVNFFVKKKSLNRTVSLLRVPVGAPIYRHSLSFSGTIPHNGRPKKKPLS